MPRPPQAQPLIELTEAHYAYLAGLLDGEGYIGTQLVQSKYWRTALEISMTHRETIDWLQMAFGGAIYTPTVPRPNARQYWKWTITGNLIRRHLPKALPYMITKRKHAELMLQILDLTHQGRSSIENETAKGFLCQALKAINRRGLNPSIP